MRQAIVTSEGIELYKSEIHRLVDSYIDEKLGGNDDKATVHDNFLSMIFYISDNIPKPSNNDIELLDQIFDIYIRLCADYGVNPTLDVFSFLVKIHRTTFTDWINGEYRNKVYYTVDGKYINNINTWRFNHKGEDYKEVSSTTYSDTAKKWKEICGSFTVNKLLNTPGTNANLIFAAKAVYGMVETAPVQAVNPHQRAKPDAELPKLGGGNCVDNGNNLTMIEDKNSLQNCV